MAVALVPVVGLLHPERHPAEPRLGEEDLQIGQAVEDAGHGELREAHRRRGARGTAAPPTPRSSAARPSSSISGSASGILERRLRRARTETVEADVHRQRHLHVDRRRPEPVVLRRRIRLAVREHAEVDALEAELRAVLELGDRVVDVRPRDDAEPDQPVARDRAVLLAEPVVVRAHRRAIDVVVGQRAPEPRADLHVREQHLGVAGRPCPARAGAAPAARRRRCRRRSRRTAATSRSCGPPAGRGTARDTAAGPRRAARRRRPGA